MINRICYLLIIHWIADFVCQSDWMAIGKSKRLVPLLAHTAAYGAVLGIGCLFYKYSLTDPEILIRYCVLNTVYHGSVDFCTSKITSWLWSKNERHWFFVMIGLDQLIHILILLQTLPPVLIKH